MIRTTYRGRPIKVLAVRGKPFHRKLIINGQTINHGWEGDDAAALDWFRTVIDRIDSSGGAGVVAMLIPGQYTEAWWYEPGTIDINPARHATRPGGCCMCSACVIDDPTGSKSRHTPLTPDACRYCHQIRDGHRHDANFLNPHRYTQPTVVQRSGRQAFADTCRPDEDDDEAPCDARYPHKVDGYLTPARCFLYADHRDGGGLNLHQDHRGFTWPRGHGRSSVTTIIPTTAGPVAVTATEAAPGLITFHAPDGFRPDFPHRWLLAHHSGHVIAAFDTETAATSAAATVGALADWTKYVMTAAQQISLSLEGGPQAFLALLQELGGHDPNTTGQA